MLLNKYIKRIPTIVIFTALAVSFLSNFINFNYVIVGNCIGYSILFNVVFIYFLYRLKYCIHAKLAMVNLTLLNIYNILEGFNLIEYNNYSVVYDSFTTLIMIITLGLYYLKKYMLKKRNK